jgi:diguanylate cyclase (GGDEF)-like protein
MQSPDGWPLLLACALVQVVMALRGTRAAALAVAVVSIAHLSLAVPTGEPMAGAWLALLSFWVASATLIVVQHRARRRLDELALLCDVDDTTGCLNRRGFLGELDRIVRHELGRGTELTFISLDLDHFKDVNDRFGHLAGDEVLYEVGAFLHEAVDERGVVARMGGEEFALLLPRTDAEAAGALAEQLLARFRQRIFSALPSTVRLTMSAGIAVEAVVDPEVGAALRARADESLYAAKRGGRDRALLWAPGVHTHVTPHTGPRVIAPRAQWRHRPRPTTPV